MNRIFILTSILALVLMGCGSNVTLSSATATSVPQPAASPTPEVKAAGKSGPYVFHVIDVLSGAAAETAPEGFNAGQSFKAVVIRYDIENTSTNWETMGLACGGGQHFLWDAEGFKYSARLYYVRISNCYVRFPPKSRLRFAMSGQIPAARSAQKMDMIYNDKTTVSVDLNVKSLDGPGFPISASIRRGDKPLPITAECARRAKFTFGAVERDARGLLITLTIENLGGDHYRPSTRDFDVLVLSQNGRFTQQETEFTPLGYQQSSFGLPPGERITGKLQVSLPQDNPVSPFFIAVSGPFGQQSPPKVAGGTPSCAQDIVSTIY